MTEPAQRQLVVETPQCVLCDRASQVAVPIDGYLKWRAGAFIQDALPQLSASERELLLTGTHPECWEKIMSGVDEQ